VKNHASHFQAKTLWKTYMRAVSAKYSKLYSSDGEKASTKKMAYVIDSSNWNFVDTKLMKSLTRFSREGLQELIFKHYTTFCNNVKSNLKKSKKKMKKNWNRNFVNNALFLASKIF